MCVNTYIFGLDTFSSYRIKRIPSDMMILVETLLQFKHYRGNMKHLNMNWKPSEIRYCNFSK